MNGSNMSQDRLGDRIRHRTNDGRIRFLMDVLSELRVQHGVRFGDGYLYGHPIARRG